MPQFSGAPLYRVYAQLQSALGTVVATANVWNSATAKLIPHHKATLRRIVDLIAADYKTGSGSSLAGTQGRKSGSFSLEIPLMPSGAAGTVPNADPVLVNVFNLAAVVSAGVSATYGFADGTGNPLTLALFNEAGGSSTQQFGYGGVAQNFSINLGGSGAVILTVDGRMFYVLESDNWANEDTTGKGGLTSSPTTEPSSPAVVGNQIGAFTASVTFGGTATVEFVSAQISGVTGRDLRMDGVGNYPTGIVQGRRAISLRSLKFADSNGAGLAAVKNAAASKTPMDVVITQGAVAGYIMTHTLKQVQFADATYSESGSGVDVDFGDAPAHASAIANLNEYTLVFT
jgi:hypothetical protein